MRLYAIGLKRIRLGNLEAIMSISAVFNHNLTQEVCLPTDTRFPDSVKRVEVRSKGQERIISPVASSWDSFFLGDTTMTDDFMTERANQSLSERDFL